MVLELCYKLLQLSVRIRLNVMALRRKDIFLKSWLWSLVGSVILVAVFWVVVGFIGFFHGSNGLVRLTDAVLLVSLIGDVLGASLIAWRVSDKYYHAHARASMKRYVKFSNRYWNFLYAIFTANRRLEPSLRLLRPASFT